MPGMPTSLSDVRSTLFAKPELAAGAVWLVSSIGYLVPSFIYLLPLGARYRDEKANRNSAQDTVDADSNRLNAAKEKLREANQRRVDLDCAQNTTTGYLVFNQRAESFQIKFNELLSTPIDALEKLLNMRFLADTMKTDVSTRNLKYTEQVTRYGYHYGCPGSYTCGKDTSCCFHTGFYTDTVTHDYTEKTTIYNYDKNILSGGPFALAPLECGYYSRRFTIASPVKVQTYESAPSYNGRKEDGATFISYSRNWGSSVTATCVLDDQNIPPLDISVLREEDQTKAATDFTARLFRFIATCVSAAQALGANYSCVQESIRQTIPGLVDNVTAANATLQEHAMTLARQQSEFDTAENAYDAGLLLWLLQLFLVPGALAGLTYLAIICLKDKCEPTQVVSETNGADLEKGVITKSSRHSPRYFNQHSQAQHTQIEEERHLVYTR